MQISYDLLACYLTSMSAMLSSYHPKLLAYQSYMWFISNNSVLIVVVLIPTRLAFLFRLDTYFQTEYISQLIVVTTIVGLLVPDSIPVQILTNILGIGSPVITTFISKLIFSQLSWQIPASASTIVLMTSLMLTTPQAGLLVYFCTSSLQLLGGHNIWLGHIGNNSQDRVSASTGCRFRTPATSILYPYWA